MASVSSCWQTTSGGPWGLFPSRQGSQEFHICPAKQRHLVQCLLYLMPGLLPLPFLGCAEQELRGLQTQSTGKRLADARQTDVRRAAPRGSLPAGVTQAAPLSSQESKCTSRATPRKKGQSGAGAPTPPAPAVPTS